MKRYFMNLIIVATMVLGGIKIFHALSPVEEGNEVVLTQIDNGKSGKQARRGATTRQAKLAMQASKRDSQKQTRKMKQALADDVETRFLSRFIWS